MNKKILYRREIAELTAMLTGMGIPPLEITRLLGINETLWQRWQKNHPELRNALQTPTPEERAEAALIKRALGFRINEATAEEIVDKKTGEILEVLKRKTITKDVPPDVRALLFYLKNRWPERWDNAGNEDFSCEISAEDSQL